MRVYQNVPRGMQSRVHFIRSVAHAARTVALRQLSGEGARSIHYRQWAPRRFGCVPYLAGRVYRLRALFDALDTSAKASQYHSYCPRLRLTPDIYPLAPDIYLEPSRFPNSRTRR
jgi:hypothetical protein